MRIVEGKNGRLIHSPWYRPEDAAAYCGISRTEFDARAKNVPHAGKKSLKLYHQNILDKWLNGELGIPFDVEEKKPFKQIHRSGAILGITHPRTGKFTPCPQLPEEESA